MAKFQTEAMERINRKNTTRSGQKKKYNFWSDAWRRLTRNPTAILGLGIILFLFLLAIFADVIAPYDYMTADYTAANQTPNAQHLFGTDSMGRDLFSRCVYGTRYSLPLGLACMVIATLVGGALGLFASYFGGAVDGVVMRIMDVLQSIPGTLMAITVVACLGTGTPQLLIALAISFVPALAKTVRAAILTVRGNEYIEACRSIGAGNLRLMIRHMIPNALGNIIIFAVGSVSASIMMIAMLSYIGLGVQPPAPEWGALLNAGKTYIATYPHMVLFPGIMIMLTILGFNLFGNGLRDALDPRLN